MTIKVWLNIGDDVLYKLYGTIVSEQEELGDN